MDAQAGKTGQRPTRGASWRAWLGFLAVLVLVPCACGEAIPPRRGRGVYYWRTSFSLSPGERALLERHRVDTLYLRLFDVVRDPATGKAVPAGPCSFAAPVPAGLAVVPVVYLQEDVFRAPLPPGDLSGRVWKKVLLAAETAGFRFGELQVDCDWSEGTREAFFRFCRELSSLCGASGVTLGATVRLHQVKYRERTGVPPVQRGMLMFYNMGRVRAQSETASIFNLPDARRYVARLDAYPLPLDVALPVFSWAVHSREGQVQGLLEKVGAGELGALPFLAAEAPGVYRARSSSWLHGTYVREGDLLRLEDTSPSVARQAAALLAEHFHPRGACSVALFDLDEKNVRDYENDDLEALFRCLR